MKKWTIIATLAAALTLLITPNAARADELVAHAGQDGVVDTARQCSVYVAGVASMRAPTQIRYRWRDGKAVVSPWKDLRADRTAPLDLCGLDVGRHALTLDVTDGVRIASDTMTATIVEVPARVAMRDER